MAGNLFTTLFFQLNKMKVPQNAVKWRRFGGLFLFFQGFSFKIRCVCRNVFVLLSKIHHVFLFVWSIMG